MSAPLLNTAFTLFSFELLFVLFLFSYQYKYAHIFFKTYDDMEELIRLGTYRKGSNPKVDEAISYYDTLDQFIAQSKDHQITFEKGFEDLSTILTDQNDQNVNIE